MSEEKERVPTEEELRAIPEPLIRNEGFFDLPVIAFIPLIFVAAIIIIIVKGIVG